jgi:hypothetical protein
MIRFFKDLDETRFIFVLKMPNIIEEYPIKKIRGVKDSSYMDITFFKAANTRTGNEEAFDSLIKSVDDAQIPTITLRVNMNAHKTIATIQNEIWTIFPSKALLLQYLEESTGKNVKLV